MYTSNVHLHRTVSCVHAIPVISDDTGNHMCYVSIGRLFGTKTWWTLMKSCEML